MDRTEFSAAVGIDTPESYVQLSNDIKQFAPYNEPQFDLSMGRVALGLLMSEKTGLMGIPNRHGPIYPIFNETREIKNIKVGISSKNYCKWPLPIVVHYNTDKPDFVDGQLIDALHRLNGSVSGVQVNNLDPKLHTHLLQNVKNEFPGLNTILQINSRVMEDYSPRELAKLLTLHADRSTFDCVWLDGSGGLGKVLDAEALYPYIDELMNNCPSLMVGVAGGLDADNLEGIVGPILQRYRTISWDAQSGVQDTIEGQKAFSVEKARQFLISSAKLRHEFFGSPYKIL